MRRRPDRTAISALGILIAASSVDAPLQAVDQARDTRSPRLEIQLGHTSGLTSVAFSPDGFYVLTGSSDGTARLWEAGTGREVRRFEGHVDPVYAVAFSPDGRRVLTGGFDMTARLWEAETGREVRRFEGHVDSVESVAFSPDGRYALTGSSDRTVRLWEAATGHEVRRFAGHADRVESVAFSPDGRHAVTGSEDRTARLWEAATGREMRRFEGHAHTVYAVAFSPDGRHVVTGSGDTTARLWEAATGSEVRRFEGHADSALSAAFSPDGSHVLTASSDKTARLWEVATGREVRRFVGHTERVESVAFSPDGGRVLSGSEDGTARLWEAPRGREVRRFEGMTAFVSSVVFSPDNRYVLTGSGDKTARLWEATTGREVRRFEGHAGSIHSVAFTPDGRHVLTGSGDKTARLWEAATGREVRRFEGHADSVLSIAFSSDGRYVLTGSGDMTTRLWEAATGREVRRFEGSVYSVAFSPDGRHVLTGTYDKIARLWEAATGLEVRHFEGHANAVYSVAFSPDGRRVLTGSFDKTARLWEAATGREVCPFAGHAAFILSVAFSPDGRYVLTGSLDTTARLWEAATGREVRRFEGHAGSVLSVAFSPDGPFIVTGSVDRTTRIWNVETGQELAQLVSFTDGTWAVADRQGRFDGANGGDVDHLYWVVGLESIGLSQLKERYYEPGLLAKKLGLNPEPLRDVAAFEAPALNPKVELGQPTRQDPVLRLELTNRGGGMGRVVVFVNGKEATEDARPRGSNPNAAKLRLELHLSRYGRWLKTGQRNYIEVRAYNAEGYLEGRGVEVVYEAPGEATLPEVTLWAVIAGVSDYTGDQIDLRYAAKDAEDVAKAIELGGRRLFGAEHLRLRLLASGRPSPQEQPTKANIAAAFAALEKATPDDIAFVYLSGHGVAVKDVYYFPTQEAHSTQLDDPEIRDKRSVSSEEIARWLKRSPVRKQVMILDTCAAGAAAASLAKRRDVSADQVRALVRLKDRTGVHLLMGSASDRESYEATQFEQGLLTHALLRGMKGAALREDQYVDVSRLLTYAADEVPRLAAHVGGVQRPHIAAPKKAVESFDIGKLTSEDRTAIPLRSPKPLLLRPTLLSEQTASDDLGLEPKLRARLREASFARARGAAESSPAVFVEADELPGAIRPSGLYADEGGRLRVKLVLVRNGNRKELRVEGLRSDPEGFAESMARSILEAAAAWKATGPAEGTVR